MSATPMLFRRPAWSAALDVWAVARMAQRLVPNNKAKRAAARLAERWRRQLSKERSRRVGFIVGPDYRRRVAIQSKGWRRKQMTDRQAWARGLWMGRFRFPLISSGRKGF